MPPEYIEEIQKGIEFNDFVWKCVRAAFGPLISMPEEPHDAPIPKKLEPSNFYREKIVEIKKELESLSEMTIETAEIKAQEKFTSEVDRIQEYINKANDAREKYQEMLLKVKAWQPPTLDHFELKNFMVEQINRSIRFDCDTRCYTNIEVPFLSAREYLAKERKRLMSELQYCIKNDMVERESVAIRNQWLEDLRNSLTQP